MIHGPNAWVWLRHIGLIHRHTFHIQAGWGLAYTEQRQIQLSRDSSNICSRGHSSLSLFYEQIRNKQEYI